MYPKILLQFHLKLLMVFYLLFDIQNLSLSEFRYVAKHDENLELLNSETVMRNETTNDFITIKRFLSLFKR